MCHCVAHVVMCHRHYAAEAEPLPETGEEEPAEEPEAEPEPLLADD